MRESIEELNTGLSCLKYIVLGFNGILLVTGCLMVSIGTTIFGLYYYFNTFLETQLFSPASVLIMIGGFIFFIALIGFVAVIKESTLMINSYCVLLCFICLLQISAGITAIVIKDRVPETIYMNMNTTMHEYPVDYEAALAMDSLQRSLKCCGIYGPHDWKGIFTLNRFQYIFDDILLPDSCCSDMTENNFDIVCLNTYPIGCLPKLKTLVYQTLRVVFGCSLSLAIIQLAGITFTNRLVRLLIRIKSERAALQVLMRNEMHNIYDAMGVVGPGAYADKPPSYNELIHTFQHTK